MGVTTAIILLISIGILLLLLEFLVIPGTTIAAIGGILFIGTGIYLSYESFGTQIGNYVLISSLIILFISIVWALRSRTWKHFMLNDTIEGKVSQIDTKDEIKQGDIGESISRLNPMGRVRINGKSYEAKSYDTYIEEKSKIKIIKIESNKLIVKLIKE